MRSTIASTFHLKCYFRPRQYLKNTSKLPLRSRAFVSRRTGAAQGRGGERRSPGTPARHRSAYRSAAPALGTAPPAMGSRSVLSETPGAQLGTETSARGSPGDRHPTHTPRGGRGLPPRSRRRTVPQNELNRDPGERRGAAERSRENRFHEPPPIRGRPGAARGSAAPRQPGPAGAAAARGDARGRRRQLRSATPVPASRAAPAAPLGQVRGGRTGSDRSGQRGASAVPAASGAARRGADGTASPPARGHPTLPPGAPPGERAARPPAGLTFVGGIDPWAGDGAADADEKREEGADRDPGHAATLRPRYPSGITAYMGRAARARHCQGGGARPSVRRRRQSPPAPRRAPRPATAGAQRGEPGRALRGAPLGPCESAHPSGHAQTEATALGRSARVSDLNSVPTPKDDGKGE